MQVAKRLITYDVPKHDHLVRVLGKDGLVQNGIHILMIPLSEKTHGLDVSAMRKNGADQIHVV